MNTTLITDYFLMHGPTSKMLLLWINYMESMLTIWIVHLSLLHSFSLQPIQDFVVQPSSTLYIVNFVQYLLSLGDMYLEDDLVICNENLCVSWICLFVRVRVFESYHNMFKFSIDEMYRSDRRTLFSLINYTSLQVPLAGL